MIIKEKDIIQIKCILAGIEKKDINTVSTTELSRKVISANTKKMVDIFFDNIDPAINKSVNSLIRTATNYVASDEIPEHIQISDDGSKYIAISKYKEKNEYIRHLEKELEERKQELKESREFIRDLILQPRNKQTGSE